MENISTLEPELDIAPAACFLGATVHFAGLSPMSFTDTVNKT